MSVIEGPLKIRYAEGQFSINESPENYDKEKILTIMTMSTVMKNGAAVTILTIMALMRIVTIMKIMTLLIMTIIFTASNISFFIQNMLSC